MMSTALIEMKDASRMGRMSLYISPGWSHGGCRSPSLRSFPWSFCGQKLSDLLQAGLQRPAPKEIHLRMSTWNGPS